MTFRADPVWPPTHLYGLRLGGEEVVVIEGWDGRGIYRVPKSGGARAGLAGAYATPFITVEGNTVFYTLHVPLAGGSPTPHYSRATAHWREASTPARPASSPPSPPPRASPPATARSWRFHTDG